MKYLYMPIETSKRELNSRLLISIASLHHGFDKVIIGKDKEVINNIKQPGVILLKSAASFESHLIDKLKNDGCLVCSLDEEGILPPLNDPSINSRFSEKCLMLLDKVFCNGMLELKSFPDWVRSSKKLVITGNPRFDFYMPKTRNFYNNNLEEIRKLTQQKKIILIVSRFGDINLEKSVDLYDILKKSGFLETEEAKLFFKGFFEHSDKIFNKFLDLPEILSKVFKEYMVVIRPHPSEYEDTWKNKYNNYSNILVSSDYDIASWLLASSVMIHNGCTTAVEAKALNTPCISYKPFSDEDFDLDYANNLCNIATTNDDVVNILNNLLMLNNCKDVYTQETLDKLNKIIMFNPEKLASSYIASEMNKLLSKNLSIRKNKSFGVIFYFKEIFKYILHLSKIRSDYSRKKYGYLSKYGYKNKINLINNSFNLNMNIRIKRIGLDIFSLEKEIK